MTKLFNRLNVALVLALCLATLCGFALIPAGDRLPAHWSIYGAVDGFAPRNTALIALPLGAAAVAALLTGIGLFIKKTGGGDVSRQFALVLSFVLVLFAAMQASRILIGMGHSIDMPRVVAIVQGLGLIAIGNTLPKTGQNTSSRINKPYDARHQYRVLKLMGLLFIAAGVVLFVAAMIAASPIWLFALDIGGVAVAAGSGVLYATYLRSLARHRAA
jgi:uncharacterized membrane protein